MGFSSKVGGGSETSFLLCDFLHLEVQEYLVEPVVELVSVSIEEVGLGDLDLVVGPSPVVGGHTCVSVSGRHRVLKNSQVLEGVQSVATRQKSCHGGRARWTWR